MPFRYLTFVLLWRVCTWASAVPVSVGGRGSEFARYCPLHLPGNTYTQTPGTGTTGHKPLQNDAWNEPDCSTPRIREPEVRTKALSS